jgi:hypothetical protein
MRPGCAGDQTSTGERRRIGRVSAGESSLAPSRPQSADAGRPVEFGRCLDGSCAFPVRSGFPQSIAGLSYRYPETWTSDQIKLFEWIRLSIGRGLLVTWVALLIAAPRLPVSWPFGVEQALLTTALLLLTNGWLRPLIRCNGGNSPLGKYRFQISFAAVALSWIAMLFAILATISWAANLHAHLTLQLGTFA